MDILPAIDLKEGKVVRLSKGLMDSATIYSDEPWMIAKQFEKLGSKWIHIVDLDGAFNGNPVNLTEIKKIRDNSNIKIELGGGIRDEETIKAYYDLGVDRIILGSIAVQNPIFAKKMAYKYPIAVGIDSVEGMVAVEGWAEISSKKAVDLAKEFKNSNVQAIICTDISKDGMLCGVNLEFTCLIAKESGIDTIASGGVKDINDIINCKNCKEISGAIVGKAFYEGKIDLKEAFNIASKE